jgi:hypothetical protein
MRRSPHRSDARLPYLTVSDGARLKTVTLCSGVTPHDVEVWAAWFEDFFATLASLFRPVEPRQTARSYLKALLGTVERKNTRQISAYTSRSNSEETAMAARKTAAPRPAKTPPNRQSAGPAKAQGRSPCRSGSAAVTARSASRKARAWPAGAPAKPPSPDCAAGSGRPVTTPRPVPALTPRRR